MDLAVGSQNGDHDVHALKTEKSPKKSRITYNKEFLVECIKNPASAKKPSGFPLPNLECTLGTARSTKPCSLTPVPIPTFGPKRKEEVVKKEKESTDSISLRPQSGSFASGCAANLNTAQLNHASSYGGKFLGMEEQSPRGFFDRELPKTTLASTRFAATKSAANDLADRSRMERDRDRLERDKERERFNDRENQREREYDSSERSGYRKSYNRAQPQWMSDADLQPNPGNNRRKNHAHNGFERDHGHGRPERHYDRDRNYRDRQEEAEPEWFSEGPTSRLDTIELRGLPEDTRNENKKAPHNNTSNAIDSEYAAMLSMTTAIDDRFETEPVGRSRFNEIFERNSEQKPVEAKNISQIQNEERDRVPTPDLPQTRMNEVPSPNTSPQKPQDVHEIEAALRSILFGGAKPEPTPPTQDKPNSDFVKMIEGMTLRTQLVQAEKPLIGMNGGTAKETLGESRDSAQDVGRMLFERSEILERDSSNSMAMPLAQDRGNPAAVSVQNPGNIHDQGVAVTHHNMNPGMIQQLINSQGPVGYYGAPISSVNFAQAQPPPGSQAMAHMAGPEHLHQQFSQMGGHRPPFGHPYPSPMHGEFVGHPPQFPPNRMPLSYPYPFHQGHIGLVSQNPLQAFQDQIRQQHFGVLSPANVYQLLPTDFRKMVDAASVTPEFINRPEVMKVISALSSGSMSLNEFGHQIMVGGLQQTVLPGVLHYALEGGFPIPVRGGYFPAQFPPPPHQPPPHQGQYQHQHQPMQMVPSQNQVRIGNFQQPSHSHSRPGVQVMPNLQFMPTSVLRKMTAEQHVRQILPTSIHQGHAGIPSPTLQN